MGQPQGGDQRPVVAASREYQPAPKHLEQGHEVFRERDQHPTREADPLDLVEEIPVIAEPPEVAEGAGAQHAGEQGQARGDPG